MHRSLAVFLCLLLMGCSSIPREFHVVWSKPLAPPADLATPAGFSVTPAQAYSQVLATKNLSLKHIWHVYADADYYYVYDTFQGTGQRRAYNQGIKVDGKNGVIAREIKK